MEMNYPVERMKKDLFSDYVDETTEEQVQDDNAPEREFGPVREWMESTEASLAGQKKLHSVRNIFKAIRKNLEKFIQTIHRLSKPVRLK